MKKVKRSDQRYAVLYIRKLDEKIKRDFKAWCIANETNMTKKVEELMKETIKGGR